MHLVSSLSRRVFFFLTQDYFVAFHRTLLAAGFTNKHANKKHGTRMLCVYKKLGFFSIIIILSMNKYTLVVAFPVSLGHDEVE